MCDIYNKERKYFNKIINMEVGDKCTLEVAIINFDYKKCGNRKLCQQVVNCLNTTNCDECKTKLCSPTDNLKTKAINILHQTTKNIRAVYQYGISKPSNNEEEAFVNWCKDNLAVK